VHDDDGPGPAQPALIVGNGLDDISVFARWTGWEAAPLGGPHDSFVGISALMTVPEATGALAPGLYAGGQITLAGGVPVNSLARWAEGEWHDVGGGLTQPPGVFSYVFALGLFDEDGEGPQFPALFAGGSFEFAGGVPAEALARWDGASWSEVGGGIEAPAGRSATVNALAVYDDGRGPALYVAGSFNSAGGKECWNIARWDGVEWEPVGPGLATTVESLCVFDEDGPGPKPPALFAGGQFSRVRGGERGSMRGIGRWDGVEWSSVGETLNVGSIRAFATWDEDGAGPARPNLYVGGTINRAGSIPVNNLVRWDGAQWHDVGGGVTGFGPGSAVNILAAFDEDGPGPNPGGLYVGGAFYYAGGVYSKHIARWGCPLPPSPSCYADCDADGELTFFDFVCFQNLFAAGDPVADCDGDGAHTFFDFLCYQNAFAAGCP